MVAGPNFHLYVVIVGYTEYVSLNIKVGKQTKTTETYVRQPFKSTFNEVRKIFFLLSYH